MRFAVFATIAALAGSAFAAAMPAAQPAPVEERGILIKSVPQIIAEATASLEAPIDALYAFTESTLTEGALAPILLEIDVILTTAVTQTLLLVGQTLTVILTDVDGITVLEVSQVAVLVADLVIYIVNALYVVAGIVDFDLAIFGTELAIISTTLCSLLNGIFALIDTILAYVTPLVASIVVPLQLLLWNNVIAVLGLL